MAQRISGYQRIAGLRYVCTIGRFPDGSVGEIFLSNHRANSAGDTNARDSAIVCSIALQFGADIETLRRETPVDAAVWRAHVRDQLVGHLAEGLVIGGFDDARGYLLVRP